MHTYTSIELLSLLLVVVVVLFVVAFYVIWCASSITWCLAYVALVYFIHMVYEYVDQHVLSLIYMICQHVEF